MYKSKYLYIHFVKCPYEVPGVVLPIASDHTAGGHHPVPHPLQAIEHLITNINYF